MTNEPIEPGNSADSIETLRSHTARLEQELADLRCQADQRVIHANLRVEAIRAGMVDLDGIKLLDLSGAKLDEKGELSGGAELMHRLRREKPWLFGGLSSSAPAGAPISHPPRQKLATEMSDEEYQAARAQLLRRRF